MNPNTNELVDTSNMTEEEIYRLHNNGFVPVPQKLNRAAKRKLAGKKSAKVSFTSGGLLSNWAKQLRKNLGQTV